MDTAVLALRTVLALVVVVGLVVVLGRVLDDRAAGRTQGGVSRLLSPVKAMLPGGPTAPKRRRPAPVLTVVGRQALGPKASVAVVDVGDQRLVLGVSEAGVTLLTSMEAPVVEAEAVGADAAAALESPVRAGAASVEPVTISGGPETSVAPGAVVAPLAFDEVFAGIVGQQPQDAPGAASVAAPTTPVAASAAPVAAPASPVALTKAQASTSPVAGSVLSPATWRQAVSAVQSRTRR